MKINSEMPPATIKGLYEYSKQPSEKVYSFELRGCVIGSILDRKLMCLILIVIGIYFIDVQNEHI